MTNHTDLAARFEAKREDAIEAAAAEARDMARAGAAGGAGDLAELAAIRAMLLAGQGDDDGMQILPDLTEDMSVLAMVASCVHLLEKRRDIVECAGAAGGAGERVRHLKRGTEYEVLGEAEAQVSVADPGHRKGVVRHIADGDRLMVYRGSDGKLWTRFTDEFRDGRFETIAAAPPPPAQQGSSSDHE